MKNSSSFMSARTFNRFGIIFPTAIIAGALVSFLFGSCKQGGAGGDFTTDKSTGVLYKFINHDEKGAKPAEGDWAQVNMLFKTEKDSVIMNTMTMKRRPGDTTKGIPIQIRYAFHGCLEQGLTLMAPGDSAIFKINADSLLIKQFRFKKLPNNIAPGSYLTFQVKLLSFKTAQQIQDMQKQMQAQRDAEAAKLKAQEQPAIDKYLADHNLHVKPNKDSMYILKKVNGKGKPVKEGDSVSVGYKGRLLDGRGFDSSDVHGPYRLVYSSSAPAIKGWVLALKDMREGDKETILFPSALAYGQYGAGGIIPPFAPLIFDMEVLKVSKAPPQNNNTMQPAQVSHK